MKQRLEWIDAIKGFGIISVMLYHVPFFVFGYSDCIFNRFIQLYFMPIFFLASGYVNGSLLSKQVTREIWLKFSNYSLLIPFFIFGLLYTTLGMHTRAGFPQGNPLLMLLKDGSCMGYWFLLVLFVCRLTCLFSRWLCQKLCLSNKLLVLAIMLCIGEIISMLLRKCGIESMHRCIYSIPFYVLGIYLGNLGDTDFISRKYEVCNAIMFFTTIAICILMILQPPHSPAIKFFLRIVPSLYVFYLFRIIIRNKHIISILCKLGGEV